MVNNNLETSHKIIIGDSRRMAEVPDAAVHLVVTSPPYWQLKDYGDPRQIGFHDSYEDYINNLNLVWQECHRVLHPGCRLCVNIGDQFARSVYYGRYKVIPIRTEIIKFCETVGFDYLGAVIWQKVTTCNTTGGATIMGSFPYPRNGIIKLDYEFILIFKKHGEPPKVPQDIKEASRLTKEEWNQYFYGHWYFTGERQDKHLAMFPEELPRRLVKMFTFVGETVLDPFLGSGTTSLAAKNLQRHSIGYEINQDFLPIIQTKLAPPQATLFSEAQLEIIQQKNISPDFHNEIDKLPYRFRDRIRFGRQADPKQFRIISRIEGDTPQQNNFYHVKEIISPELVILNDGLKLRLLGIKEIPDKKSEAIAFLSEKTKGQKVFLKFDTVRYDDDNNLLGYLYLRNKTFINAHLIKNGLVEVDRVSEYACKKRFLSQKGRVN